MSESLLKKVMNNEYNLVRLFCDEIIRDNYIRFYDDKLKDMYDHNFFDLYSELTPEILSEIKRIREERNEKHIKVCSYFEIPELETLGYEKLNILTMAATNIKVNPLKISGLEFKNLKDNPELINDFMELDNKYDGRNYGASFVGRRLFRYFTEIIKDNGINYFGCYFNNKLIALCYSYYSNDVVAIDGLIVEEKYRRNNIAINLVKYVQDYYQNCPIYLHTEDGDYPKTIYEQIGFTTLYNKFEYLLVKDDWY